MSIPEALFLLALLFAVIEQIKARGESLVSWAVILIAIGLLWGALR